MIKTTPNNTGDQKIDDLRAAIEHRAAWFYLLIKNAREAGLDDKFAHDAIFQCGCDDGQNKFPRTSDLDVFIKAFANDNVVKIFEMDVKPSEDKTEIDFYYCPLVAKWKKLGVPDEELPELCQIAMDGDRGIISQYPDFEFHLGKTIAQGHHCCEITISKKK
ncbi:MAG: L-2-amino-thiazoline-4-carboxylic acid hydrolase [Eubacteriales bacterium]|nr:L-2-amino-thiazoline-4-carboxylic acid hydrolase [Eubacteriales bacterium]